MWLEIPWLSWIGIGVPLLISVLLPALLTFMLVRKRRNRNNDV